MREEIEMGQVPSSASETRLFKDILKQAAQLKASLSFTLNTGAPALERAAEILRRPEPVVISGIGASWHAGMAIHAVLLGCGIPSLLIDASELLHFGELPMGATVLLLSRSGKSTEIVQLVEMCRARGATLIAITNQADSPLALGCDVILNTSTDFDNAVSITTYSSIGLTGALLARKAAGQSLQSVEKELGRALDELASAIHDWRARIESSGWLADGNGTTYFLARGASLASCHEARLLWEEAAKSPATALAAGGFRHGPQEMIRAGMRIGLWIDAESMRTQDLAMARDLKKLGVRVLLIGQRLEENAADCVLSLPAIPARWQFLIDIIPIQVAANSLASIRGEDPDSFRFCSYIVEAEGGLCEPEKLAICEWEKDQ